MSTKTQVSETVKTPKTDKKVSTPKSSKVSATKSPVTKAEQIRQVLTKNPEWTNQQVVNHLWEKEVSVWWSQVEGARKVMNKINEVSAK